MEEFISYVSQLDVELQQVVRAVLYAEVDFSSPPWAPVFPSARSWFRACCN